MTQFMVAHEDGLHRVYRTETGIDRAYVTDAAYRKPRKDRGAEPEPSGASPSQPAAAVSPRAAAAGLRAPTSSGGAESSHSALPLGARADLPGARPGTQPSPGS